MGVVAQDGFRRKESLKVAVLMGGPSEEHAISLKSGHGVVEALAQLGWAVEPVVIPKTLTVDEASEFTRRTLQQSSAEVVFIALHGRFGEDGTIQQVCEDLRLAYVGSGPEASRLGMDKIASLKRFEEAGLSVPRWRVIDLSEGPLASLPKGWSYPVVLKPSDQGSSLGVSIVREARGLPEALALVSRFGPRAILEEFVAGRELTVSVFGETALPVVEIRPHQPFFDYTAKYTPGMTDYLVPAPLPPELARLVQTVGVAAHRAIGCRHFSRADLILTTDHQPVLLEVNTIPGFTPTSLLPKAAACAGMSYEELCEELVLSAWRDARPLRLYA